MPGASSPDRQTARRRRSLGRTPPPAADTAYSLQIPSTLWNPTRRAAKRSPSRVVSDYFPPPLVQGIRRIRPVPPPAAATRAGRTRRPPRESRKNAPETPLRRAGNVRG